MHLTFLGETVTPLKRQAITYLNKLLKRHLLGLIIFSNALAQSQSLSEDYILKHWTVDDGLPVNEIVHVAQTQDGYIWLATFDGLIRFDGDQFKVFNTGNIPIFPTNRFIELKVDRHDNLWIVTEIVQNSEVLISYRNGQFQVFDSEDGLKGKISMQLDGDGNMMIGSDDGAFYYDGKSLQSFGNELKGKLVRKIVHNSENVFWFATDEGAFQLLDGTWKQYTEQDGLDSKNIYDIYVTQQGHTWIATDKEIGRFEKDTIISSSLDWARSVDSYINIYENPKEPNKLYLNNDGHLIYVFENDKFTPYPNKNSQGHFEMDLTFDQSEAIWVYATNKLFRETKLVYTTQTSIRHIYADKIGNIWVAQRNGLVQLKPRLIKAYNKNISTVYSLMKDSEDKIWATQNHLAVFQLRDGIFDKVSDKIGIPYPRPSYSLYASVDGVLWIGSKNGVFRWDKTKQATLVQPPISENDSTHYIPQMSDVKGIQEDAAGNLWFGGKTGIHRLDKNNKWHYIGEIDGNDITGVRLIYITRDSTIWFGTNGNGLLSLKDGQLHQIDKKQGLSSNIIRSIYEDEKNILWVGTEGWGLNRIKRSTTGDKIAHITIYNKRNGLFDNTIHQILEDDQGRLWMNSNRGIFWVDREELNAFANGKISNVYSFFYGEQDGLPGREGNGGIQPAGFKTEKGEIWFPMMGGIASINPAKVQTSQLNIFVEEIQVSDSTWYVGNAKEKIFPKGQRDFQIRYAALDYSTSPANIRYRYKLEGYKEEWIETENRKEAIFNNLSPGTYTFKVMANNGGGWLKNEASLQIILPHFFYETYWFYGLVVLLFAFIIYTGVNWRIRILKQKGKELEKQVVLRTQDLIREKEETERQKEIATEALETIEKQAAELKELDQAKSRFFTNISHEFRTPLTLIIGPLEDQISKLRAGLAGDEEDMEVALRNSKRLLHLVNQILEVAKLESGHTQLQVQLIDICSVVDPIIFAFKSMAEYKGIEFSAVCPDEPVMMYIDTDLIEKAIINLISNAFKFTSKQGSIEIWVRNEEKIVSISVKDNGCGIPKEDQEHIFERFYQVNESSNGIQPGTGIGLSLVHELIVLHNGTIELISEPGKGSEFLIKLKKGKAHLKDIEYQFKTGDENSKRPEGIIERLIENEVQPMIDDTQNELNNGRPLLLIVEDNADIRRYVYKHMSTEYDVIEAENGLEGFQKTEESLPDLVISDVMMPFSDGYDLCRKIKQHPDLDFIPVILLTAKAEKSMKIEGLELGADDYITKPFEIDELKARVRNLIRSRQKLKERLAESKVISKDPDLMGWVDTPFANRVRNVIEQHISDEDFSVVQLAKEVGVGRTTLYSRIVEFIGKTPSEMIKLTRLYQAAQLLKEDAGNISEIAYATGFKSISHFSKTFKAEFEVSPTEYKRLYSKT